MSESKQAEGLLLLQNEQIDEFNEWRMKNLTLKLVFDGKDFKLIELGKDSHVTKLLQRIRDEAHRFAVSYHSTLKTKRQTESGLETLPSIGPATRKRLIKTFGSLRATSEASLEDLSKVVGPKKAVLIQNYLQPESGKHD